MRRAYGFSNTKHPGPTGHDRYQRRKSDARRVTSQPDDPLRLGRYELTGRLGEGGQGVVYSGHGPDGVLVAIKLLQARVAGDARARKRFVRELAMVERVADFCTARVLEAGVHGDQPYIVSELVEGPALQELVGTEGLAQPWWITELAVPADNHLPQPHVHVDHQYVAVAEDATLGRGAVHTFAWFTAEELAELEAFEDTQMLGTMLFGRITDLADQTAPGAVATGLPG